MITDEIDDLLDEDLDLDTATSDGAELYEHFRVVADKGQELVRVDKFLIDHLPHASRNRIQKSAEAGCLHVNGKPVKSNYRVKPRDIVTIMMDRPRMNTEIEPEEIPLEIVYEDDDLMVINKPAGMVVHPGCGNYHGTLVNAIAWHLRDNPNYDPNDPGVGLVHRIDKDTSGLLVVAKTPDAKTHLGIQFFNKTTKRHYNALVWGALKEDNGTIRSQIARNPPRPPTDGRLHRPRHRQACRDTLQGAGAHRLRHPRGVYPRDGTHTPDTRPHEAPRAPALQ